MSNAYFEMIGGASGNMILGALADAGADLAAIEAALRTIPVEHEWSLVRERVVRRGISALHVDFHIAGADEHGHEAHAHRTVREVLAIIAGSGLRREQKERASAIYVRLGEAEARVHGTSLDTIHFHEVGQVDAILDVAAACVALDVLGIEQVWCSPYPLGRGTIAMAHGRYPNPPPATAELLRGAPTYDAGIEGEMVTTTGAAILSTLVARPGERPPLSFERIGYGAGRSDFAVPNVLRVIVGPLAQREPAVEDGPFSSSEVGVLETNIDDMNPQFYEAVYERLFEAGALDVWTSAITMKKGRPAVALAAMCPVDRIEACARAILEHTTSIGLRVSRRRRLVLEREAGTLETPYGQVRYKTVTLDRRRRRSTLEYDDLRRLATAQRRPIAEIAAELERYLPDHDH